MAKTKYKMVMEAMTQIQLQEHLLSAHYISGNVLSMPTPSLILSITPKGKVANSASADENTKGWRGTTFYIRNEARSET
jgi:hypothetical protein